MRIEQALDYAARALDLFAQFPALVPRGRVDDQAADAALRLGMIRGALPEIRQALAEFDSWEADREEILADESETGTLDHDRIWASDDTGVAGYAALATILLELVGGEETTQEVTGGDLRASQPETAVAPGGPLLDGHDALEEEDGTGGQDRESYSDDQDRENYTTE